MKIYCLDNSSSLNKNLDGQHTHIYVPKKYWFSVILFLHEKLTFFNSIFELLLYNTFFKLFKLKKSDIACSIKKTCLRC